MDEFTRLVETESRGLVAAVTAIVGDADRAEEIVQEAFVRCHLRWWRVARLDRPGAWVRRVAVNQAISVVRRRTVEVRALARVAAQDISGEGCADPLAAVEDHDVWAAVRLLPSEQAAAIALRYGADLGIDDIALALETSPAAVKSLLHRGRSALRGSEQLAGYRP